MGTETPGGPEAPQIQQTVAPQVTETAPNMEQQVQKATLQQTIDEAKKDGKITQEEVDKIIDSYNNEYEELSSKTKDELLKLHKEIGEKMLKNGIKVAKNDLKFMNKLLVSLGRSEIKVDEKLKDKDYVISMTGEEGKLTVYASGLYGTRIGYYNEKGDFETDTGYFKWTDINLGYNDGEVSFDSTREIRVEKTEKKAEKDGEVILPPVDVSVLDGNKTGATNIAVKSKVNKKDKIVDKSLQLEYTKKFLKNNEKTITEIKNSVEKISNNEDKATIKEMLDDPTENKVKAMQEVIKPKDKLIDGKFGPNTMAALKEYVEIKAKEADAKLAAQSAPAKGGEDSAKGTVKATDGVEKQAGKVDAQASAKVVGGEPAAVAEKAPEQPAAQPAAKPAAPAPAPAPAAGGSK